MPQDSHSLLSEIPLDTPGDNREVKGEVFEAATRELLDLIVAERSALDLIEFHYKYVGVLGNRWLGRLYIRVRTYFSAISTLQENQNDHVSPARETKSTDPE